MLIVLMKTLQPRTNLIVIQQYPRGSGILRQNLTHRIQHLHSAICHIA